MSSDNWKTHAHLRAYDGGSNYGSWRINILGHATPRKEWHYLFAKAPLTEIDKPSDDKQDDAATAATGCARKIDATAATGCARKNNAVIAATWRDEISAGWDLNPNYPRDPRPYRPPMTLRFKHTLYGLIDAPTLHEKHSDSLQQVTQQHLSVKHGSKPPSPHHGTNNVPAVTTSRDHGAGGGTSSSLHSTAVAYEAAGLTSFLWEGKVVNINHDQ